MILRIVLVIHLIGITIQHPLDTRTGDFLDKDKGTSLNFQNNLENPPGDPVESVIDNRFILTSGSKQESPILENIQDKGTTTKEKGDEGSGERNRVSGSLKESSGITTKNVDDLFLGGGKDVEVRAQETEEVEKKAEEQIEEVKEEEKRTEDGKNKEDRSKDETKIDQGGEKTTRESSYEDSNDRVANLKATEVNESDNKVEERKQSNRKRTTRAVDLDEEVNRIIAEFENVGKRSSDETTKKEVTLQPLKKTVPKKDVVISDDTEQHEILPTFEPHPPPCGCPPPPWMFHGPPPPRRCPFRPRQDTAPAYVIVDNNEVPSTIPSARYLLKSIDTNLTRLPISKLKQKWINFYKFLDKKEKEATSS